MPGRPSLELRALIKRFHGAKSRCGRDRFYRRVSLGFPDARAAAEYMLAQCGPLPAGASIDRIDPRRGYEPGNLRYATPKEQIANRRFARRERVFTSSLMDQSQ